MLKLVTPPLIDSQVLLMRSIQLWNHRQPSQSIARKPYIVSSAEVSIVGDEKNPISTDWLGNLNIFNAFNVRQRALRIDLHWALVKDALR